MVHLPKDIDDYLHRVGRTARAGREGLVVNLVTQRDLPLLAKLRKRERSRPRRASPPGRSTNRQSHTFEHN
jgi:superfamily II DNA/RNA helicase